MFFFPVAIKMQSRGSELGSVGLADTQVFFVWRKKILF